MKSELICVAGVACLLILIAGPVSPADAPAQGESPPDCKADSKVDYYPASVIRKKQEGRVLVEYRVDAHAHVTDIHIFTEEAGDVFREPARKFMEGLKCKVPPTWETDGGPTWHLRVNIVFEISPGGVLLPISPKDPVANITGKLY